MIALWRSLRRFGVAGLAFAVLSTLAALAAAEGLLDPTALVITLGGGLGVLCVTFPRTRLALAWTLVGEALMAPADPERTIATLKQLGHVHRVDGIPALERAGERIGDPFLHTAVVLAVDARNDAELQEALIGEARREAAEGEAARQVLVTLGKLFPAFGLIGTLMGLVSLMRHLSGADLSGIGPGLGMAVLTTLYGAVLSNVVVLPLNAKLQAHLARRALLMQMMIEGSLMVYRREYPTRIERALRAYLGVGVRRPLAVSHDDTIALERAA
jgi:chemotaxis protein MotA